MNTSCGRILTGLVALFMMSAASAQNQTTSSAPARPAIPFPATPTPKPKEEPMTPEQLDAHLVPTQFLSKTSDVLTLVYSGFRRSQIDPCGCVTHQLGGLDKEARLVTRIDELKVPALQVDAGGFMRENADPKAIDLSKHVLKGLGKIGYDVINVGYTDLAAEPADVKAVAQEAGLTLVSANITDAQGQLVFDPYAVKEVQLTDGSTLTVGVIGVTRPRIQVTGGVPAPVGPGATGNSTEHGTVTDPQEALNKYLPELAGKADFVVVLHYDRRANADKIVAGITDKKLLDVLVLGENSQIQGNVQEVEGVQVVSGGYEGRQVGTLYVELNPEKNVASTWNKHIEVLQTIPPVAEVTSVIEAAHAAAKAPTATGTTSTAPGATPASPTKLDLGT